MKYDGTRYIESYESNYNDLIYILENNLVFILEEELSVKKNIDKLKDKGKQIAGKTPIVKKVTPEQIQKSKRVLEMTVKTTRAIGNADFTKDSKDCDRIYRILKAIMNVNLIMANAPLIGLIPFIKAINVLTAKHLNRTVLPKYREKLLVTYRGEIKKIDNRLEEIKYDESKKKEVINLNKLKSNLQMDINKVAVIKENMNINKLFSESFDILLNEKEITSDKDKKEIEGKLDKLIDTEDEEDDKDTKLTSAKEKEEVKSDRRKKDKKDTNKKEDEENINTNEDDNSEEDKKDETKEEKEDSNNKDDAMDINFSSVDEDDDMGDSEEDSNNEDEDNSDENMEDDSTDEENNNEDLGEDENTDESDENMEDDSTDEEDPTEDIGDSEENSNSDGTDMDGESTDDETNVGETTESNPEDDKDRLQYFKSIKNIVDLAIRFKYKINKLEEKEVSDEFSDKILFIKRKLLTLSENLELLFNNFDSYTNEDLKVLISDCNKELELLLVILEHSLKQEKNNKK